MIFMMIMSLWGVVQVIENQFNSNNLLVGIGFVLIIMALLMVFLGVSIIVNTIRNSKKA